MPHCGYLTTTYLVLQDAVERLDDPGGVPPLGRLDHIRNGGRCRPPLGLDLAHRSETASRECLLELAGNTVIGVVVRLERSEQLLPVLVALLLRGDAPSRRRAAVEVVDVTGICMSDGESS